MIMQEVAQELQCVTKFVEAEKVEIEKMKKQLQDMEVKLIVLEKKLSFVKTKKKNLASNHASICWA